MCHLSCAICHVPFTCRIDRQTMKETHDSAARAQATEELAEQMGDVTSETPLSLAIMTDEEVAMVTFELQEGKCHVFKDPPAMCEYECPIQGRVVGRRDVVIELVVHSRAPGIYRAWVDRLMHGLMHMPDVQGPFRVVDD